jgi:hypothetical protein
VNHLRYWNVGSTIDKEDVTDEFLAKRCWYDGYSDNDDDRYADLLEQVSIGVFYVSKQVRQQVRDRKGRQWHLPALNILA